MKLQKKIIWISLLILLSAGMGQGMAKPVEVTGLVPGKELSDDWALKPGLVPIYIYNLFKTVEEMPKLDIKTTKEKMGEAIFFLDHTFGKKDPIFDSGVTQGIGIHMNGFLKFSKPGILKRVTLHLQRKAINWSAASRLRSQTNIEILMLPGRA